MPETLLASKWIQLLDPLLALPCMNMQCLKLGEALFKKAMTAYSTTKETAK